MRARPAVVTSSMKHDAWAWAWYVMHGAWYGLVPRVWGCLNRL